MGTENGDCHSVVLGLDFGATNLKALLVDKNGQSHHRFIEPSSIEEGHQATLQRIVRLVKLALQKAQSKNLQMKGIGVGVCGPVNYHKGEIVESPVLPGWKNTPVIRAIQEATNLRVMLDNDANLAVLGEWWRGAGKGHGVIAGLTIGTGIGGGLVIDGRVYRGGSGFGAEFGHIQVAEEPSCLCGGKGCLGQVASVSATILRYRRLASRDSPPVDGLMNLAEEASQGNPTAAKAIEASAGYLAKGVLILVNCLNPDVFVICGGMSLLGDSLLKPVRKAVRRSTFETTGKNIQIVTGSLGLYSGCMGAARLAWSGVRALPEKECGLG